MIISKGDKSDLLSLVTRKYEGLDYSKKTFVFTGQGGIYPGALKERLQELPLLYSRLKEISSLFETSLGFSSIEYILSPNKLKINEQYIASLVCQLALQVGLFDTVRLIKGNPEILIGHSYGDFSATFCSGLADLSDLIDFMLARFKAMKDQHIPATMIAVISSELDLTKIAGFNKEFWLSNVNGDGRFVLSVSLEYYEQLLRNLKELKIPAMKLDINEGYHSPLMSRPEEELSKTWNFRRGKKNYAKFDTILTCGYEIKAGALVNPDELWAALTRQFTKQVDLPKALEYSTQKRVHRYIEIAPVSILASLIQNEIAESKVTFVLNEFPDIRGEKEFRALNSFSSKIINALNLAMEKLTGYRVVDIEIKSKVKEDLGIDSIKKAEVVFNVLDNLSLTQTISGHSVNLSELKTIEEMLVYLEGLLNQIGHNSLANKPDSFNCYSWEWVKFSDIFWSETRSKDFDYITGEDLYRYNFGSQYAVINLEKINGELNLDSFGKVKNDFLFPILSSLQKVAKAQTKKILIIIKNGTWGMLTSHLIQAFCIENNIKTKILMFDDIPAPDRLNEIVHIELEEHHDSEVRYIKEERFVKRLALNNEFDASILPHTTFVILGGSGAIGGQILKVLSKNKITDVVVVGRRKEFNLSMYSADFEYKSVNVLHPDSLERLCHEIIEKYQENIVFVNATSLLKNENFSDIKKESFEEQIDIKIQTALILNKYLSETKNISAIHFGSIAGEFGTVGQAPYYLSNAFLGNLSDESKLNTTISWPAWKNIGMASDYLSNMAIQLSGLGALSSEDGYILLEKFLLNKSANRRLIILEENTLAKYHSIKQCDVEYSKLFQRAPGKDKQSLLKGLTLDSLPHYADHLVNGKIVFPGSGSLSLMFYCYYSEYGKFPIGYDFKTFSVGLIQKDTSKYFLGKDINRSVVQYSIESNYLHSQSSFEENSEGSNDHFLENVFNLREVVLESTDLESIFIGPMYVTANRGWCNEKRELIAMIDLAKSSPFSGINLWDKLHKLFELCMLVLSKNIWLLSGVETIPKSIKEVRLQPQNLFGDIFFFVCTNIVTEQKTFADISVLNQYGKVACYFDRAEMVEVARSSEYKGIIFKDPKCPSPITLNDLIASVK